MTAAARGRMFMLGRHQLVSGPFRMAYVMR
jgi:hypothetical protein